MSQRSQRKEEHLQLAGKYFQKDQRNDFDQIHLVRPTLPETVIDLNSIKTKMFQKDVDAPFFIEAMTGGSKTSQKINSALGRITAKEHIALALGSASIIAKEPGQIKSFLVARDNNPNGVLIANVNPNTPIDAIQTIITELKADALQIHLNTVQELVMPEGERNFKWLNNLLKIRQAITIPIIIKEVGFGFDKSSLELLKANGFKLVDLGGAGGTNFAKIENGRRKNQLSYLDDIGLSTAQSIFNARAVDIPFFASGGIRNPLDILKSLVLNADAVGIANTFLQILQKDGLTELETTIHSWKEELASLLALFGANSLNDVSKINYYLDLPLKNSIEQMREVKGGR